MFKLKLVLFLTLISLNLKATVIPAKTTFGGPQIIGGMYHSELDIFEGGIRCIEVDEHKDVEIILDQSATVSGLTTMDYQSLEKELGVGFSIGYPFNLDANAKISLDYLKNSKESETSIVFIYKTRLNAGNFILKGPHKLTREALDAAQKGKEEFRKYCGDQFVYKLSKGAKAFVTVKIDVESRENKRKIKNEFSLGIVDLLDISLSIKKLREKYGVRGRVTIFGYQEGGFAASINKIFGGVGVASCNTTDLTNCELTIRDVLNYFSHDFPKQFEHFYRSLLYGASPLPSTAKTEQYVTRSYCLLAPHDKPEFLDCPKINLTPFLEEISSLNNLYDKEVKRVETISSIDGNSLSPSSNWLLLNYKNKLKSGQSILANARINCLKDSWSCKSIISKTKDRLYPIKNNIHEEISMENRLEICLDSGFNSISGGVEIKLQSNEQEFGPFQIKSAPPYATNVCYSFENSDIDLDSVSVTIRARGSRNITKRCKKRPFRKYTTGLDWELNELVLKKMTTGDKKVFSGKYFFERKKCKDGIESLEFTPWYPLRLL